MSKSEPKKLYAERDPESQGEYYMRHLNAMTAEELHHKGDIASELAHRDMLIDELVELAKLASRPERDSCDQYHGWHNKLVSTARCLLAKAQQGKGERR